MGNEAKLTDHNGSMQRRIRIQILHALQRELLLDVANLGFCVVFGIEHMQVNCRFISLDPVGF